MFDGGNRGHFSSRGPPEIYALPDGKFLVRRSLKDCERRLDSSTFFRASSGCIVNLSHVKQSHFSKTEISFWVGEDRGAEALREFWRRFKLSGARLKAVAMDMSGAYACSVRAHAPHAILTFDRFHVMRLMNERLDERFHSPCVLCV